MPLDFTAIDFETANSRPESACQVGLARVRDGEVVDTAAWLIRPPAGFDEFFAFNSTIHGIYEDDVAAAPGWAEQFDALASFVGSDPLVAHSAVFDMGVLRRSAAASGVPCPPWRYLCSLQVARKTYRLPSYRLPAAAAAAGFSDFAHHDAGADALACAHIVIDAARRSGADDVDALAAAVGVRMGAIDPVEASV
ncbi:3'-5' exonuclease [Microbacterium betulae]|uniref:3'-5' exonuclease n=1 Tax=Microbacterium betulae TaxID=2981139 RepID=A0AA97I878_9MICO|nr:3'-5' exonuclease [Microbacterium sp. AB]WOF24392.1 3'-5' exonuclease [Microbacterium sp. AB]